MKLFHDSIQTPLGEMSALSTEEGVCLLEFKSREELGQEISQIVHETGHSLIEEANEHIRNLNIQLQQYFKGHRDKFTIPLVLFGTEFQKRVWGELQLIPFGETRTYQEQTESLGDPKAIRAVASANGKNKIAILVPCHRVIGSDGSLTGYAGGVEKKRALLQLEGSIDKDLFS